MMETLCYVMYVDDVWLAISFNNREFDVRWMSAQLNQLIQTGSLQSAPLFLATRLMRAHHISSILKEVDVIDSDIGAPQLSMPRRQSIFEFARLVPFVALIVVAFFLANPQRTFRIRTVKLVSKCHKKNLPGFLTRMTDMCQDGELKCALP